MKILHILAAAAAASAATLAASPASAQQPASSEQVTVRYSDLDLSSQAGQAQLNRRILTAVQIACGPTSDSDPHGKNVAAECRHRTYAEATSQVRQAIALAGRGSPIVLAGR